MTRTHLLPVLAGAVLAAASPALAQEQPGPRLDSASAQTSDADFRTGFAGSGLIVEAGADKTDASIAISWSRESPTADAFRTIQGSIKATTPLGDDETSADFITDRGLAGVGSLEFNFSQLTTDRVRNAPSAARIMQIVASATAECLSQRGPADVCESGDPDALQAYMTAEQKQALEVDVSGIWTRVLSITAGVGSRTYKFRDPLSLAKDSVDETPFSFSVQYGGAPQVGSSWTSGWYRGGGIEYSETYEEATAQTLCSPAPPPGPIECFTSPYSAPELERRAVVYGLLRREGLSNRFGMSWGAQLKAAYDFESEVAGLEGTLYVIPGGDALRGGIRFKIQTEDDNPLTEDETGSIGLFVGKPF
jgi:hypothetical protein